MQGHAGRQAEIFLKGKASGRNSPARIPIPFPDKKFYNFYLQNN
jgi:hypothetical protein